MPLTASTITAAYRIKCGEVYTTNFNGDLYAVECHLCEERPFCTLSEYAEHMDVWHRSWQETPGSCDSQQFAEYDDLVQEAIDEIEAEVIDDDIAEIDDNYDDDDGDGDADAMTAHDDEEIFQTLHNSANDNMVVSTTTTTPTPTETEAIEALKTHEQFQPFEQVLITNADDDLTETQQAAAATKAATSTSLVTAVAATTTTSKEIATQYDNNNGPDDIDDDAEMSATLAAITTTSTEYEISHAAERTIESRTSSHANNANLSQPSPTAAAEAAAVEQLCTPDLATLNAKSQILYGLNEPIKAHNTRLTSAHIEHLIDLYRAHPRLWNQSHAEFSETQLVRQSWQEITNKWNQFCQKQHSITDVRIRVSTLCQRYMKERQRLAQKGEYDECSKFVHYERLKFLDEQQTIQLRRKYFEQQNFKIIDIYKHYPLLWHSAHKPTKNHKERMAAIQSISTALKLCGIHLSPKVVLSRIKTLRKCYRVEKIRFLHSQVEQGKFEKQFMHFEQMQFLDKHINPFVCTDCGKIFEHMVHYRDHVQKQSHGELPELDELAVSYSTDESETGEQGKWTWEEEMMMMDQSRRSQNDCETGEPMREEQDGVTEKSVEDELIEELIAEVEKEMSEKSNENDHKGRTLQKMMDKSTEEDISSSRTITAKASIDCIKETEQVANETSTDLEHQSQNELVIKVACGNYSYDLKLNASQRMENDDFDDDSNTDEDKHSAVESFARLTLRQTHTLIEMYKKYPTLWDPNHLDYPSRKERRLAWGSLTEDLNKTFNVRYSWKTLHRKLTDFIKYYRREKQRLETMGETCTKWCFYDDFAFLDDVLILTDELQKSIQQKDCNLKIIKIYENHPQLWDTNHPEYTKRSHRQKFIESLNTQLQEANIHLTADRLRNRLIDFRFNYRTIKEKRLEAEKRKEPFNITYEFYEALQFLEPHIAPFQCKSCDMTYKRHSDFILHNRKVHDSNDSEIVATKQCLINKSNLDNVCHICGIKFTSRSNLICHLRRHLNERTHACPLCPKKFFTKNSLNVHIRSHTKEQPYQCDKCGRSFVNASKLNQHLKRHLNQRNFGCEHCEKTFFTAFERERHARVHSQIRDKVCPICGKDFIKGSAYYSHMHLHRSEKRFQCDICNAKFAQYSGLYKHRKRNH